MPKKRYYAYSVNGETGVASTWDECFAIVDGEPGAKYKGFESYDEAAAWLEAGADYRVKHAGLEAGIYFDAGTGAGNGVEISVADQRGSGLLWKVLPEKDLNYKGHFTVGGGVTNNFGELLACKYALRIALDSNIKKVFGDSALILDYWSKGYIKKEIEPDTIALAHEVKKLRYKFEQSGGQLFKISGGSNPADLGFHKS
jgi:ribonuclease HI